MGYCEYYDRALGGFALSKLNLTLELVGSKGVNVMIYDKYTPPVPDKTSWLRILAIIGIFLLILLVIFLIYYFCFAKRNAESAQGREDLIA